LKTRKQLVNKSATTEWLITVGESIGKGLEVVTIFRGRKINLLKAMELRS
jgi:hypothetical protein